MLLSLLSELQKAFGVGVDVSVRALAFALSNARTMGLLSRALFVRADIRGPVPFLPRRFDVVVSNPPIFQQKSSPACPRISLASNLGWRWTGGIGG